MKILVVDDSFTVRRAFWRTIHSIDPLIETIEAENGKAALKALTMNKVDLIITDLEMEGGSGIDFVKHIGSSSLLKNKPIIIYSGKDPASPLPENVIYVSKSEITPVGMEHMIKEIMNKINNKTKGI